MTEACQASSSRALGFWTCTALVAAAEGLGGTIIERFELTLPGYRTPICSIKERSDAKVPLSRARDARFWLKEVKYPSAGGTYRKKIRLH